MLVPKLPERRVSMPIALNESTLKKVKEFHERHKEIDGRRVSRSRLIETIILNAIEEEQKA